MVMTMREVILLWDAANLWGLLAWQALNAFRVPCRLEKCRNIAHTLQSDKPRLVLVPGGTARSKFEALGPAGVAALRDFIARGGHYLGFCGGAGLGLSGETGLGLCPWQRAGFTDRLQHLMSGHVEAAAAPHPLAPPLAGVDKAHPLSLPVWWPGRFAAATPSTENTAETGRDAAARTPQPVVLARYQGPGADLHMVDVPLASLPEAVRRKWRDLYGVSLIPETLRGEPCVVHGAFGEGSYTLSYSHLETPDSPEANRWLAHLLHELAGVKPALTVLPPWRPEMAPVRWDDMANWSRRMDELMELGRLHGLLFDRTPWLTGWKNGVPGAGLNALHLALHTLASTRPGPESSARWAAARSDFAKRFALFYHGTEELLLARRLAATLPEAVPGQLLSAQRHDLFGSAMHGGGLYQDLMNVLDDLLFLALQER